MCLKLTDVYYDHLCRPDGHARTLAAAVVRDPRVQAIRVPTEFAADGTTILANRPIVTAIVKGAEKPPADADLVAWSCE